MLTEWRRPAGINTASQASSPPPAVPQAELGAKVLQLDKEFAGSIAVFYMDWQDIQVRFRFDAQDDQFNDGLGWIVDDVRVLVADDQDLVRTGLRMILDAQPGIEVVILYPRGKISPLQEKLFCTLGGNITTVAVDSDFDTCQRLVKDSFEDAELKEGLGLNSANSINIARLMAQVCYYFEAGAAAERIEDLVFSVPSGNFGNLTAGLVARRMAGSGSRRCDPWWQRCAVGNVLGGLQLSAQQKLGARSLRGSGGGRCRAGPGRRRRRR